MKKIKDTLCFMHLGKVGGRAISTELFNRFDKNKICNISPWQIDVMTRDDLKSYDVVIGHWAVCHIPKMPEKKFLFSMVRDPIDRVLSAYWFLRSWNGEINSTNDVAVSTAKSLPLEDWIKYDHPQVIRVVENYQTRHFGNDWREATPVDKPLFARAVESLDAFDLVGLHERYDETLQILCARRGWMPWPSERRLNVTPVRNRVTDLPGSVLSALRDRNEFDQALYEHARAVFDQTLRNELRRLVTLARAAAREEEAQGAPERIRFGFDQALVGMGWQPRVESDGRTHCWIGPDTVASIELAVRTGTDLRVQATIVAWIDEETAESITLTVAGEACRRVGMTRLGEGPRRAILAEWLVPMDAARRGGPLLELVFHTARAKIIDYPGPNGPEPLSASVALADIAVEPAGAPQPPHCASAC